MNHSRLKIGVVWYKFISILKSFYELAIGSKISRSLILKLHRRKNLIVDGVLKSDSLSVDVFSAQTLATESIECAVLHPKLFTVYNTDGKLIDRCNHLHTLPSGIWHDALESLDLSTSSKKDMTKYQNAFYGGLLYPHHYGHFITESLSRLWALQQCELHPDSPILFHIKKPSKYNESILTILKHLKIESRIRIIDQMVSVVNLTVASQANILSNGTHPKFIEFTRSIGKAILNNEENNTQDWSGKKVYLTKSRLANKSFRNTLQLYHGETELESKLRSRNYLIIAPEELTIANQIRLFSEASRIVGCLGSAFHTMYLAQSPKATVTYLVDGTQPNRIKPFLNCDRLQGVNSTWIPCLIANPFCLKRKSNRWTQNCIIDLEYALSQID